jgi:hypothetical protein
MDSVDEYREKYELAKRRIISSLDRLRRLGFFEDYSNLTSEELFEKIRNGELGREWPGPWESIEEAKRLLVGARDLVEDGGKTRILTTEETAEKEYKESIEEWMKKDDFDIDAEVMAYDTKRVILEDVETSSYRGFGLEFLQRLVQISRGAFNPTDIREEWHEIVMKDHLHTYIPVRFKFRGKEHLIKFLFRDDYMYLEPAVGRINELIKDTGYQYYIDHADVMMAFLIVLTEEEVKMLMEGFLGKAGYKMEVVRAESPAIQKSLEVDDVVKDRFIDSIDYLRGMGFFEEYRNLTSEEIFKEIKNGEIGRDWLEWWGPKVWPPEKEEIVPPWRSYDEPYEYDYYIACHDIKRMFFGSWEGYTPGEGNSKELLEKLVQISRGAFNPTDVREGKKIFGRKHTWWKVPVYFKFRGQEYSDEFIYSASINIDSVAGRINELIKDTGYQYYRICLFDSSNLSVVVLTEEEVKKLVEERGWELQRL